MNDSLVTLKRRATARIDELRPLLEAISLDIHANPELGFKEHRSSRILVNALREGGLTVETGTGGLETAFRAEHRGAPGPTIAVLAEYDALPGIGHACGHNLICTAALGAGLAVASVAPDLPGCMVVLGTPAEEGGGGKVLLARAGAFDDVDAAMMFHAASKNLTTRGSLAMTRVTIEFHGKAAHAAAALDQGVNALEALIQTFVAINGLRQHLRRDAVVHGIITDGGKAANVVPDYAAAAFSVRARDSRYRDELVEKVRGCVQAAGLSTGARGVVTVGMGYDDIVPNPTMADLFARNLERIGLTVETPGPNERMGSTDMGDVSQIIPGIHPYLAITDASIVGHTVEFEASAKTPRAQQAMTDAAKALAMTSLDLFYRPELLAAARAEFQTALSEGRVRGRSSAATSADERV
ncbi:MAG: M20 family metallopeptidase [Chloroflexi bacterium]|nr:M20 family metallopeptidase [Chloroflexota bacterium]